MPKRNNDGRKAKANENQHRVGYRSGGDIPSSLIGVRDPHHSGNVTRDDVHGQGYPKYTTGSGSGSGSVTMVPDNTNQNQTRPQTRPNVYDTYGRPTKRFEGIRQGYQGPQFGSPIFGKHQPSAPYLNSVFGGGNVDADRRDEDLYLYNQGPLAGTGSQFGYQQPPNGNGDWFMCEHGRTYGHCSYPGCLYHSGGPGY